MVTDPPYGVEYDAEWRVHVECTGNTMAGTRKGKVAQDDVFDWSPAYALFPGAVAYVWHAGRYAADLAVGLMSAGLKIRTQIIWKKAQIVFGRGHYHWQHEPCWYAVRDGQTAKWEGDRKQSTIWEVDQLRRGREHAVEDEITEHSTQKPVECMERPIRNHGGKDDAVYEPFSGSGTTLIAAERQQRQCFAMEITPADVQMAIDRWEAFTGQKAQKVGEGVRA